MKLGKPASGDAGESREASTTTARIGPARRLRPARRRSWHIDGPYREWPGKRTDVDRFRRLYAAIVESQEGAVREAAVTR
jgi:hypothetical protein